MPKTHDPSKIRVTLPLRALAAFIDLGIIAGLSVGLASLVELIVGSAGGEKFTMSGPLLFFPVVLLYYLYFASEMVGDMRKSLGKQFIGIEIREENGLSPRKEELFKRFLIKHSWLAIVFIGYVTGTEIVSLYGKLLLGALVLSTFPALGASRQSLYDDLLNLAIFPVQAPRADLTQLSQGVEEGELAQIAQAQLDGSARSNKVKQRAKATLTPDHFPCAVELNVYLKGASQPEELLFECFAQFIPNVHPNQFQASSHSKGPYRSCRVVMRFDTPLQMETSYGALSQLSEVVMTTTIKSVKLGEQKKRKSAGSNRNIS